MRIFLANGMFMRMFCRFFILVSCGASLIACDDEAEVTPTFALSIMEISDGTRLLDWEELENAENYTVWRSVKRQGVFHEAVMIASVDFLTLSYVDEGVPVAKEVQYYVTSTADGREIRSNVVSAPGATYLPILPYQMKLLPEKNIAIVRGYNTMFLLDYEEQVIVGRREFSGKLGAFDMVDFDDRKELYVPSSDHNIYILDPYYLSMIDTLNANYPVSSVAVNSKGTIYFSCSHVQAPLKLYDRTTMTFISQHAGESDSGILLKSDTELIAISSHLSPATMSLYTFGDEGALLSRSDDPYGWDYEMDSERMKISPKYIVTSIDGFVYTADASFSHVATLAVGNNTLTDFEFSEDNNVIYSAVSNGQRVNKHVMNGVDSYIMTTGYPWILARNGAELIVLSSPESFFPSMTTSRVIVERVPL